MCWISFVLCISFIFFLILSNHFHFSLFIFLISIFYLADCVFPQYSFILVYFLISTRVLLISTFPYFFPVCISLLPAIVPFCLKFLHFFFVVFLHRGYFFIKLQKFRVKRLLKIFTYFRVTDLNLFINFAAHCSLFSLQCLCMEAELLL